MIRYFIQSKKPTTHYIDIEILFPVLGKEAFEVCLPVWRPGRYELGNFAKNVRCVEVFDDRDYPLHFEKTDKSTWRIKCAGKKQIKVVYSYFSFELNAGSTYADEHQLYINPVNCLMYSKELVNLQHELNFTLPSDFTISTSLEKIGSCQYSAADFHELADSPVLAGNKISTFSFQLPLLKTQLHLNEGIPLLAEKMMNDFSAFMEYTIKFFGDCPVSDFHFLFQLLPFRFYHGVEHLKSTVIAIGPTSELLEWKLYAEILGVSCHEFFHVWNIKFIRPAEMLPYDYSRENYSRSGFVYEGFTTYYGDLLLWRSGVFTERDYLLTLAERINKHLNNFGRFNLSLADSSFDTWLDGYVQGAPHRKVSIYDEGNLLAFILDIHIMVNSEGRNSLRNVCVELYNEFGKKGRGYTLDDIIGLCNKYAEKEINDLFSRYLFGKNDYFIEIESCLSQLGFRLAEVSLPVHEHYFGFKTVDGISGKRITMIAPDSPAELSGLSISDEITEINGNAIGPDLDDVLKNLFQEQKPISFTLARNSVFQKIEIRANQNSGFFTSYSISKIQDLSADQIKNYKLWHSPLF